MHRPQTPLMTHLCSDSPKAKKEQAAQIAPPPPWNGGNTCFGSGAGFWLKSYGPCGHIHFPFFLSWCLLAERPEVGPTSTSSGKRQAELHHEPPNKHARQSSPLPWHIQQQLHEKQQEEEAQHQSPYSGRTLSLDFSLEQLAAEQPPAQEPASHEDQVRQVGYFIPHFFDPDLTSGFRPVYVVADFLLAVASVVPFGLKHYLY